VTDEQGKFALEDLDPELLFELLVYHDGFVPLYSRRYLDPDHGEVELTLTPHDLATREPERVLRGIVLDAHRRPIPRATIHPVGRKRGNGQQYGGLDGVDDLALSDENGEFALGVSAPGEELLLSIESPGYAPRTAYWLRAGPDPHEIAMQVGVTVRGVVTKDGQPLRGIELGLAQDDRSGEHFTGEHTVGTDAEGRFTFVNVPPDDAWHLYGKMASARVHGALPARPVKTGADGSTLDVGTLALEPGARLAGRVVLSDGRDLPEGLRVLLGREHAWDTQTSEVGAGGTFAFQGVPRELCTLDARVGGYVVSERNASCDFLNRMGLLGVVDGDVEDLVLLLEPGEEQTSFDSRGLGEGLWERYQALQESPLRGAPVEAVAPGR
jgi:hypothetical protein